MGFHRSSYQMQCHWFEFKPKFSKNPEEIQDAFRPRSTGAHLFLNNGSVKSKIFTVLQSLSSISKMVWKFRVGQLFPLVVLVQWSSRRTNLLCPHCWGRKNEPREMKMSAMEKWESVAQSSLRSPLAREVRAPWNSNPPPLLFGGWMSLSAFPRFGVCCGSVCRM